MLPHNTVLPFHSLRSCVTFQMGVCSVGQMRQFICHRHASAEVSLVGFSERLAAVLSSTHICSSIVGQGCISAMSHAHQEIGLAMSLADWLPSSLSATSLPPSDFA